MAHFYKWEINEVVFYPFGGLIKFNSYLNKSIKEEFFILISGPLFQILFYLIMIILFRHHYLSEYTFQAIKNYHYSILIFNLLPIIPLDGSKLINLFLAKFFPYKKAHLKTLYISYFTLLITFILVKYITINVSLYLLLFILLFKLIEEGKKHHIIFNKFLLERYIYNFKFSKIKYIKGKDMQKMMRGKRHLFYVDNKYITEKELLKQRFKV